MRFILTTATHALGISLWSSAAAAQTNRDVQDVSLFELAYKAVEVEHPLPRGRRVIAVDDPLLRIPSGRRQEVRLANTKFADVSGLSTAALKEVLVCTSSCSFKGDIVASTAFRMVSRLQDSAVVYVATRHFSATSRPPTPRWQLMALHEVYLARRNREWTVVGLSILAES